MVVHSALPEPLTAAVEERLRAASVQHVAHGSARPMRAAEAAAGDPRSLALIGPYRSADVAEAVEATAPVGLPLLAPVATWAGVTRDDEPGCEDPAQHHGTILRLIARDTEVAARIAADVRSADRRAFVIAGEHSYGQQLDGQLRLAGLPRADDLAEADVIVRAVSPASQKPTGPPRSYICPSSRSTACRTPPSMTRSMCASRCPSRRSRGSPRPISWPASVRPGERRSSSPRVCAAAPATARRSWERSVLSGPFDNHGDPIDPPVWLWRACADWALTPDRPLASSG